jgi:hypothetical protein
MAGDGFVESDGLDKAGHATQSQCSADKSMNSPNAYRYEFAFLGLIAVLLSTNPGCDGRAEIRFVEDTLNKIPGVTVVRVWGNDDLFDLGAVNAEILLEDGVPAMLFGMGRTSFESSARVRVAQIGSLSPWVQSYACRQLTRDKEGHALRVIFTSGELDVSTESFAAHQLVGRFENVFDALSRQEDLRELFAALPRCPAHNYVNADDGREYRYCIQDCPTRDYSCTSGPGNAPTWVDGEPCS